MKPFEILLDIREDTASADSGGLADPGELFAQYLVCISRLITFVDGLDGQGDEEIMKGALIALGVIVLLVLIVGGSLMGSRNDLVTEQEAYKAQWQQVDVVLQRRRI